MKTLFEYAGPGFCMWDFRATWSRTPITQLSHLYVIEFASGVIKVGATGSLKKRLRRYREWATKPGGVPMIYVWISEGHGNAFHNEDHLIAFCRERASVVGNHRERFVGISREAVVSYAATLPCDNTVVNSLVWRPLIPVPPFTPPAAACGGHPLSRLRVFDLSEAAEHTGIPVRWLTAQVRDLRLSHCRFGRDLRMTVDQMRDAHAAAERAGVIRVTQAA